MNKKLKKKVKVSLHKDPLTTLLNKWKRRKALSMFNDQYAVAATLGFCIRELEEIQNTTRRSL